MLYCITMMTVDPECALRSVLCHCDSFFSMHMSCHLHYVVTNDASCMASRGLPNDAAADIVSRLRHCFVNNVSQEHCV